MVIMQPSHLNTGLFSLVFRCHLNTRPFANRTTSDHLNTRLVRYSDGYCIHIGKSSDLNISLVFKWHPITGLEFLSFWNYPMPFFEGALKTSHPAPRSRGIDLMAM